MDERAGERIDERLAASVETALGETFGGNVRLDREAPLPSSGRSSVFRLPVREGPPGAPTSVIVKCAVGDADHPYTPDSAPHGSSAERFVNDWAGARFLSDACPSPPVCPRLLRGDRENGFIVLEDLGEGDSLAEALLGSDAGRAERELIAYAVLLGRMHAATAGREGEFRALWEALAGNPGREEGASPRHDPLQPFRDGCDSIGVTLPAAFDAEWETAAAAMRQPGPFLAYTHGDPCPDNNRITNEGMRLFDFEHGGFRHCLRDGVYGRVPFPTCWCVNRLPEEMPGRMESAYRAELVKGCPEAGDDGQFRAAMAAATACWTFETAGWHLKRALEEDDRWGEATIRQRLLVRFDNLAGLTERFGRLEALGAAARESAKRLRFLWPPEADAMPLYPAFR